ncbi:MAG TPA: flagellar hook protein FlgE [Ignavibacteriales bacterium]|nr:flagellar hook protein FlgE [Ignavibacteriales bacterium]HPD67897.1 flagellar hook protein FlgE [Ignavibacteriales bacterium]HRR17711.1 flagellar hook protein FlgE [Ignavibacteriales bacterium]HRT99543.1 flagellar hook protein FlgE [Ignavibacteriales bacterium]
MALLNSMLSGVSGLKNHQIMMDIVGNNISNVNTVGYKQSRVTFAESLSQVIRSGKQPNQYSGGQNSFQVGFGTKLNSIDRSWQQGTFERTGIVTDLALQGNALFILKNYDKTTYTRAGSFTFDEEGNLVNPQTGGKVQGKLADANGVLPSGNALTDIKIDLSQKIPAKATSTVNWIGNLSTNETVPKTMTRVAKMFGNIDQGTAVGSSVSGFSQKIYSDVGNEYTLNTTWTKTAANTWTLNWVVQKAGVDVPGSSGSIAGIQFEDNEGKWTMTKASKELFDGIANKIDVPAEYLNFTIDPTNIQQKLLANSIDSSDNIVIESEKSKKITGAVSVYDSLGTAHTLSLTFMKIDDNKWHYEASVPSDSGMLYNNYGTLEFNTDGTIKSIIPPTVQIEFDPAQGAQKNQMITLQLGSIGEFNGITQTAAESTLTVTSQDGAAAANLLNINIDQYGVIEGVFSNGKTKSLAQIMVANFANRNGLIASGDNQFVVSANSGEPIVEALGQESGTTVQSQALEQSNVDLAEEFTRMIVAQRGFQANARVITTSDNMLQELTAIVR